MIKSSTLMIRSAVETVFEEFFDLEDMVELGGVYFNIRTHEIVGFIPEEKLKNEIAVDLIALSVDPEADRYWWITPYAYCLNNPVKLVDPDGRKIVIAGSAEFRKATFNDMQKLSSNNLVMLKSGQVVEASKYKGDKANIVLSGTGSGNKEYGTKMVGDLAANTKHTVTIQQTGGENNSFLPTSDANAQTPGMGSGGILSYDPETTGYNIVNQDGTTRAPSFIFLGHELIHADKAMKGKILNRNSENGKWDPDSPSNWPTKAHPEEIDTRKNENVIRKENNVKPRAIPE